MPAQVTFSAAFVMMSLFLSAGPGFCMAGRPACHKELTDFRSPLDSLKLFQAVGWHLKTPLENSYFLQGRIIQINSSYVWLAVLSTTGRPYFHILLKNKLAENIMQWNLPPADSLRILDEKLENSRTLSLLERSVFAQQRQDEQQQRELQEEINSRPDNTQNNGPADNRIDNDHHLLFEDLPPSKAILHLQQGSDETLAAAKHSAEFMPSAYRTLLTQSFIGDFCPEQNIELHFDDTTLPLSGTIVTLAPLVLKVNVVKQTGTHIWGLLWIDATKIKQALPVLTSAGHLIKGQTVHWAFREKVHGLQNFSGTILQTDPDGAVLVCGLDRQGIPSRWRFTPRELELVENVNLVTPKMGQP